MQVLPRRQRLGQWTLVLGKKEMGRRSWVTLLRNSKSYNCIKGQCDGAPCSPMQHQTAKRVAYAIVCWLVVC